MCVCARVFFNAFGFVGSPRAPNTGIQDLSFLDQSETICHVPFAVAMDY